MGRVLLALATAGALAGGGILATQMGDKADAQENTLHPERLVIGLDLSRSNPLIADPGFAARVADRIATDVSHLGFASEVHIRTFGNYDPDSNTFAYDVVLSVRARPEAVAQEVRKLIANTPYLVRTGKWRAQKNTNIIAFLDNVAHGIGCQGMPTTVILASDGIEDSGYARLDRGDSLPAPEGHPFEGCHAFDIYGLGQGTGSPKTTTRLRAEWSRWSRAAGFAEFEGLNDW